MSKANCEKDFDLSKLGTFTQEGFSSYEQSRLTYIEMKGVIDTASGDGITKERLRMAKELKESRVAFPTIIKATGLTEGEIQLL